jgi:FkbM family methyltransferase
MSNTYSQNNEQEIILNYFGDFKGRLLDIGANDGRTLSNSLALIEKGWEAVCVEPAPHAFARLCREHYANPLVMNLRIALGKEVGKLPFQVSGELLKQDDTCLVSTLVPEETHRWAGTVAFETIHVEVTDWQNFTEKDKTYDFISIDAEGMDLEIVKQMNLKAIGCKLLCIEWNSKDKHLYDEVVIPQGYELHAINAENLIYSETK